MRSSAHSDVDTLLRHAGWMRSLARSLVADPNVADDLVQDTWVAALEHPPEEGGSPRRWLSAVLRNFAREQRRRTAHRAQREEKSARPEAIASAHDAVASALLQRSLVEAVLVLEEPYRDVIVWRFFEGLPPREIASRLRVPVNTVKTRLARGIEKLRTELDRRNGGNREAWLPALIPLAVRPEIPASALWTLLVNTNLKLALAAMLVAGALFGIWSITRSGTPEVSRAPHATIAADPSVPSPKLASESGAVAPAREPAPMPDVGAVPAGPEETSASAPILARGRVVDAEGRSVARVELVSGARAEASGSKPVATSSDDGSFEARSADLHGNIFAKEADYTTVFGVDAWSNAPMSGLVVVVAPRILLAGAVVDATGKPIAGAQVHIRPERAFLQELGLITDQSFEVRTATQTGDDGRFEIQDAPGMPHAGVEVVAAGFEPARTTAPRSSTHSMKFVLERGERPVIRGEVVDARDRPVPGAWLAAGMKAARADADGRFVFEPGESVEVEHGAAEELALVVVKEGFLPAHIPKPATGWPAELVVRLEGAPLSIRGRVADSEDRPIEGVEVWTLGEQRFAMLPGKDSNVEHAHTIESLLRGSSAHAVTDAQGAFEIGGLMPKDYRLAASHTSTLRSAATGPVRAGGEAVSIRLPGMDRCARVAGRVLSRTRSPIGGVLVFPFRVLDPGDHSQYPPPSAAGEGRLTDAEGRFAFEAICGDDLFFQVSGPNLEIVWKWDPPPAARLDDLEIVVALRCHVQVDLGDRPELADEFRMLDGAGKELDLALWEGPRASIGQWGKLQNGRSDILGVSDASETLVLKKDGKEVQRIPVRPVPGELTIIRP